MKGNSQQPVLAKDAKSAKDGFAEGRGVAPAARTGAGTLPCRGWLCQVGSPRRGDRMGTAGAARHPYLGRISVMATAILLLLCTLVSAVEPDRLFLRDGRTLSGNIVGDTPDTYRTLIPYTPTALLTNVPVKAVRFVVYGTPAKARTALRLEETARALGARDSAKVKFLPTEAFGEAITEAVGTARERVWILAYYISGGSHPAIQRFYDGLRTKARTGVAVQVISEFGNGTPMPIRNGTMNFAHTLQEDGVQVRFMQEYRVMHKKMLLVDRDRVLLGSSNLTGAGVDISDEFNVLIISEPFARKAEADFKRMAQRAQPIDELDY